MGWFSFMGISFLPKNLVQYWSQTKVPEDIAPLVEGWKNINAPNWKYTIYDKSSAGEFIAAHAGNNYKNIFDNCALPAMQSDLFRYIYIYYCGGVYVDAASICLTPLDGWLSVDKTTLVKKWHGGIMNGFIAAPPYSQILADVIAVCESNIKRRSSGNIYKVTGPYVLMQVMSLRGESARNVSIMEFQDFSRHVKLVNNLAHKRTNHWSLVQQKKSIYTHASNFESGGKIKMTKNNMVPPVPLLNKASANFVLMQRTKLLRGLSDDYYELMRVEAQFIKGYLPQGKGKILDIGSGLGGIHLHLHGLNPIMDHYLLDKDRCDHIMLYGFRDETEAYNSFDESKMYLLAGGLSEAQLNYLNCELGSEIDAFIEKNAGKIDLVISLKSWCFHYPASTYIDMVNKLLRKEGKVIVDMRDDKNQESLFHDTFRVISKTPSGGNASRIVMTKV